MPLPLPSHGSDAAAIRPGTGRRPARSARRAPSGRRRRPRRPGRAPRPAARRRRSRAGATSQPVKLRRTAPAAPMTMSRAAMVMPGTGDRGPAGARSAGGDLARPAGRTGRHEQPQQQVDDDAGAAGEREGDEADPPEQRVDAAVLGQPAADAAEDLVGAAAAQLGAGRRPGGGRRGLPGRRVERRRQGGGGRGREAVPMSCQKPADRRPPEPSGNAPIRPWFLSSRVITGVGRGVARCDDRVP